MDENILFNGTLYRSGFRYIVTHLDDMMRIGYREDGESDEWRVGDVSIGWDDAAKLVQMIIKLAELNNPKGEEQ